jgi:cobalt-zinc-cadmium efflux system outer membrane protein
MVMKPFFILVILFFGKTLSAQDTLKITLAQADSILMARNLSIIAFRYEIDKADAARIQAGLFNNPQVSVEFNLYNPAKTEYFDVGPKGQKAIALQQVFRIAGQRNTAVKLATEQKRMTESQYYELTRAIRYELHVNFYRYYFLNHAITNIQSQLGLLRDLIDVYQQQYHKGNISLQELTRLNTTHFGMTSRVNEIQSELVGIQETLKILLSDDRTVWPIIANTEIPAIPVVTLSELQDRALVNRPELKTAQSLEEQSRLRYALERKEAIPNLTAGALYDQAGSYINNYTAVTAGLQIPLFNRNQGRIRYARAEIDQSKVLFQTKQQQIVREVETALKVFQVLQSQYTSVKPDFEQQLTTLSAGLVANYSKNNISLLEFTDLFESYNANIIQFNQLKAELTKSYEELNYAVGEDLSR